MKSVLNGTILTSVFQRRWTLFIESVLAWRLFGMRVEIGLYEKRWKTLIACFEKLSGMKTILLRIGLAGCRGRIELGTLHSS